jgi:hypothetical protein
MPADWLSDLPWRSWELAGLALLLSVALPQLLAAWLVVRRYFFLQPAIAGCGLLEMLLAWVMARATANATTSAEVPAATHG